MKLNKDYPVYIFDTSGLIDFAVEKTSNHSDLIMIKITITITRTPTFSIHWFIPLSLYYGPFVWHGTVLCQQPAPNQSQHQSYQLPQSWL